MMDLYDGKCRQCLVTSDDHTNDHTIMTWWRHDVSSSCATLGKPGFYVKSHLMTCHKPGFDIKPSLVTLVSLWWYRHVIVMLSCRHTPSRFWYTYSVYLLNYDHLKCKIKRCLKKNCKHPHKYLSKTWATNLLHLCNPLFKHKKKQQPPKNFW